MQKAVDFDDALARKYPEAITIAIVNDARGKPNPITLGWAMTTSADPLMFAVSIGLTRYSLAAFRHSAGFVLALPSAEMVPDAIYHGTHSGRDEDKLAACGTRTTPATRVPGVLLCDAVANLECEKVDELATGDHVLFTGRVVAAHVHADPSRGRLYSLGNENFGGVQPA